MVAPIGCRQFACVRATSVMMVMVMMMIKMSTFRRHHTFQHIDFEK